MKIKRDTLTNAFGTAALQLEQQIQRWNAKFGEDNELSAQARKAVEELDGLRIQLHGECSPENRVMTIEVVD